MANWRDRIESVAIGLLTLEVNTIRKSGMSAQKMPEVPIALHSIIECYADYLAEWGYGITQGLLDLAKQWVDPPANAPPNAPANAPPNAPANAADDWRKRLIGWSPSQDQQQPLDFTDLTNGAGTFQALRWAAAAALRDDNVIRVGPNPDHALDDEVRAVIARIASNSRQLSPLVSSLEKSVAVPREQLSANPPRIFGGTLEQTAQALFSGLPAPEIPIETTVQIRKAWDVGTETVLLQTSVQVDGDVITRISPSIEVPERDFLLSLHNGSVQTGLGQWKALFDLVKSLMGELGRVLFGGE